MQFLPLVGGWDLWLYPPLFFFLCCLLLLEFSHSKSSFLCTAIPSLRLSYSWFMQTRSSLSKDHNYSFFEVFSCSHYIFSLFIFCLFYTWLHCVLELHGGRQVGHLTLHYACWLISTEFSVLIISAFLCVRSFQI